MLRQGDDFTLFGYYWVNRFFKCYKYIKIKKTVLLEKLKTCGFIKATYKDFYNRLDF